MKIPFMFGIHCHQPAENFYHVVDMAIEKSYSPFLEVAVKYPRFRFAAHYSGWLLEYIRTRHAEVFARLKKLSSNGQIEFFTGGFYEPVLSAIPSDDRRGQIKMLSDYIENHFGQTPDGLWLTERVWDPAVIPDAYEVGVKNIIVDDYHLIAAGFPKASLTGYFRTEQDGCPMNLFPIDMGLRYLTPFRPREEVLDHIKNAKSRGVKLITCFDDGEKFGVWPKTYEWVYKKGWLADFIEGVLDDEEIEFMHYAEAAATIKPAGIAYLPITSYEEMGEWSLFSDRFERFEEMKEFLHTTNFSEDTVQFLKGSIWKNFFVKYPESNRLHKRTLDLSLRGRPYKNNDKFCDLLYKSQCNDSLWHGIFGGLYLPNLRNNAWNALIDAESEYEKLAKIKFPSCTVGDCDFDGFDEAYIRTENINYLFVSRDCGQLAAIELKKEKFNLLNTISRKHEGYHAKYTSEHDGAVQDDNVSASIHEQSYRIPSETRDKIAYDWYNKNCFIDHFTGAYSLDEFEKCSFGEFGDFANQPAELTEKNGVLGFRREGGIAVGDKHINTVLDKTFKVNGSSVEWNVSVLAAEKFVCDYVSECNLHFADMSQVTLNGAPITERGSLKGKKFALHDPFTKRTVTLEYADEVEFGWFTLYTVSQSESGIDLTVQGVTLLAVLKFDTRLNFGGKMTIG